MKQDNKQVTDTSKAKIVEWFMKLHGTEWENIKNKYTLPDVGNITDEQIEHIYLSEHPQPTDTGGDNIYDENDNVRDLDIPIHTPLTQDNTVSSEVDNPYSEWFKKENVNYSFTQIEVFARDNNYEIQEHGNNVIGENFLVLKHNDKDITVSFILSAYGNNTGNVYTCIYSDLK